MDERKCALYRITHKESGKDYVGISVRPYVRWKGHIADSKSGRNSCPVFHNFLNKYGAEAFEWKIIAWARNFECGKILEKIARHTGMGFLNCTAGGDGMVGYKYSAESKDKMSAAKKGRTAHNKGLKASEETRKKISESGKGRTCSPEHRLKISEALKGRPKPTPSDEVKAAISKALIGNIPWNKGKKLSPEHCKALSQSHKKQKVDDR